MNPCYVLCKLRSLLSIDTYLVLTSNIQRLTILDSSNNTGNHPFTHTRSCVSTIDSSTVCSWNICHTHPNHMCSNNGWGSPTCGLSATCLAQCRMILMASMLVSGKAALHANSDKHLTASWNESIVAEKCSSNIWAAIINTCMYNSIMFQNGGTLTSSLES